MKCPNCNKLLLPENEYYYEDFGINGDGIVHVYSCQDEQCDIEQIYIYIKLNDENNQSR
jgi:hypothetical protein